MNKPLHKRVLYWAACWFMLFTLIPFISLLILFTEGWRPACDYWIEFYAARDRLW